MRKIIYILFMLPLLTGCSIIESWQDGGGSADWMLSRADEQLSGYTSTALPSTPVLLWSFKDQQRTVASPVVLDGTAFWVSRRGKVHGVDSNGMEVFTYDLATSVEATPTIADSTLYIGTINGELVALSISSGQRLWSYQSEGQISATPNLTRFEGNRAVVFGSYDNYLYTVNLQNGELISRFESGYYLNGAVAIWDNHVLFGGCDQWMRMIDCQTGMPTDSVQLDNYIPCSPAIMGNLAYVGDYSGNIYELSLSNGKIAGLRKLWEATDQDGDNLAVPALDKETVYVYTGERTLTAINRKDGSIRWRLMLKGRVGESSPLVCGKQVLVCTKTGIVSIVDAATGEVKWEYDTGEDIVASPAVIKGRFYILTTRGTLLCFVNED